MADVINPWDVKSACGGIAKHARNDAVVSWFKQNLRNHILRTGHFCTKAKLRKDDPEWAVKAFDAGAELVRFKIDRKHYQQLEHVRDYLDAQIEAGHRVNTLPVSLAIERAKRWVKEMNARLEAQDDANRVVTVLAFPDGYSVVRLEDRESFNREGKLMGHCVASYHGSLGRTIYSLRDPQNHPHVTMEVRTETQSTRMRTVSHQRLSMVQCKGKGNAAPVRRYLPYIVAFSRQQEIRLDGCHDLSSHEGKDLLFYGGGVVVPWAERPTYVNGDHSLVELNDRHIWFRQEGEERESILILSRTDEGNYHRIEFRNTRQLRKLTETLKSYFSERGITPDNMGFPPDNLHLSFSQENGWMSLDERYPCTVFDYDGFEIVRTLNEGDASMFVYEIEGEPHPLAKLVIHMRTQNIQRVNKIRNDAAWNALIDVVRREHPGLDARFDPAKLGEGCFDNETLHKVKAPKLLQDYAEGGLMGVLGFTKSHMARYVLPGGHQLTIQQEGRTIKSTIHSGDNLLLPETVEKANYHIHRAKTVLEEIYKLRKKFTLVAAKQSFHTGVRRTQRYFEAIGV